MIQEIVKLTMGVSPDLVDREAHLGLFSISSCEAAPPALGRNLSPEDEHTDH